MQYPHSLLVVALALSFTFISCSGSGKAISTATSSAPQPSSLSSLERLYQAAVTDAINPEPSEISSTLTRIQGNPLLLDTIINGEWHLLAVSWKSNSSYYPDVGAYNTGKYDLWITVVPQLQERCRIYSEQLASSQAMKLRLQQLMGLPPDGSDRFFLELWVRPDDIFRPCPDNETSDTECGLSLPPSVDSAYRAWFNDLRAVQYVDCSNTQGNTVGYPWTQLGYTYDWHPDNSSHIGLSEFVVKRNTNVWVRRKVSTEEYCSQANE